MLRISAITATFWTTLDVGLGRGLEFLVSVVLARILSPEDFGIVAMLYLFVGIAGVLVDSGVSATLILQKDVTPEDEVTAFACNMAAAFLVSLALIVASPAIARFYAHPVLAPMTVALALNVFISALASVPRSLLQRKLEFRKLFIVSLASTLASGAVAVDLAFHGWGVWTLVWQTLAATMVQVCLVWILSGWRPRGDPQWRIFKRIYGFSSYLALSSLLEVAYVRSYTFLLGKFYSAADLGLYARAESLKHLPIVLMQGVVSRVAFPLFARVADDRERLRRGMKLSLQLQMMAMTPLMLGLASVAPVFIDVIFGPKWLGASLYLQILCFYGLIWPLELTNMEIMLAQGRSREFFQLELIKKLTGITLMVAASQISIALVAVAFVVSGAIGFGLSGHFNGKLVGYGALRQVLDQAGIILSGLLMFFAVRQLDALLHLPAALELVVLVAIGAMIYIALVATIARGHAEAAWGMLQQMLRARRGSRGA